MNDYWVIVFPVSNTNTWFQVTLNDLEALKIILAVQTFWMRTKEWQQVATTCDYQRI